MKFTRRPLKSSSLRKTANVSDDVDTGAPGGPAPTSAAAEEDDDDGGPAVIRPVVSRSGSTKAKKKASSKLSFGATEDAGGSQDAQAFTPKKPASLTQRATENNALRSSLASRKLPTRSFGPEQDSTSYSREYLEELQSSTPNTPQNIASLRIHDGDGNGPAADAAADAMDIDPSELEGAVVVPQADLSVSAAGAAAGHMLSATEIQEKKERRARLAKEGGAYDEDDEEDGNYISLTSSARKQEKDNTRLIAEDEDLGEGYDDFVEDARLELGKRGEKEARRRHRREMEELINAAEGASEEEDADSDAERLAAYEAAQTRAAMGVRFDDGAGGYDGKVGGTGLVIPRMKALPELGESLGRMRELVRGVEEQAAAKRKRIENLEREKQEILDEEKKVQEVLNQEGMKYQAALGIKKEDVDPLKLAAESPLRTSSIPPGGRGLESFGTTPVRRQDMDEEMAD